MIFWIIRNSQTGEWLPEDKKAYSWSELTHHQAPRLHLTEVAAKITLSWWLKGPMEAVMETEYDEFGSRRASYCTGSQPSSPEDKVVAEILEKRKKLAPFMEVVKVNLVLAHANSAG